MPANPMERHLFQHSFDDGWLDVLAGTGLVAIGLVWLTGVYALGAIVPAILFPFWKLGRQRIVEPRLGRVRFSAARENETRRNLTGWLLVGAGALVTETVILLYLNKNGGSAIPGMTDIAVAIPVFLVGIGLLAGLMIGARRFIAYAVLAGAIGIGGIIAGIDDPAWLILAAGAGLQPRV